MQQRNIPLLQRRQIKSLLFLQRRITQQRIRNISRMPIAKVHPPKIVEHRLSTPPNNLLVQCPKTSLSTPASTTNGQCGLSAFMSSRRNNPSRLRQHHNRQIIGHLNKVDPLPFNRQCPLRYHTLQSSNTSLIAAPIRFISNEQHAILQMTIKLSNHLFPTRNLKCMRPKYPLQTSH